MASDFRERLTATAFAFRGYNVTNLGRSAELLAHPLYGATVATHLNDASEICSTAAGRRIDLADRVRRQAETSLATYDEAIGLVLAMELAQLRLLDEFFGIRYQQAALAYGYSLGEIAALIAGGVFGLQEALPLLMELARECAEIAPGVTLGVLFSRGPLLDADEVQRLCLQINRQGQGIVGISSYLAPNSVLLMGQTDTLDRFAAMMHGVFPDRVYLRKNSEVWPPLHTPLLWERGIPNRAAHRLHSLDGGFVAPTPPILSMVTGKRSYNDYNCRDLLHRWVDHPQRLWDAVSETLSSGIETVIHVGPDPNLIPATFKRLSDNVTAQLKASWFGRLHQASGMVRRPWLSKMISARAALLRAPFLHHVILEDWLLEQPVG
jgi:[acyl-carrier-protein] S-malonyltransferase